MTDQLEIINATGCTVRQADAFLAWHRARLDQPTPAIADTTERLDLAREAIMNDPVSPELKEEQMASSASLPAHVASATETDTPCDLDLDALEKRYTSDPIPPCSVCGAPLKIARAGGGAASGGRGEGSEDKANHDCLAKRRDGEPMFILLGRDPDAHNIVRFWAERRLAAGGDPEHCRMGLDTSERMKLYAADPANAPASAPPASAYPSSPPPNPVGDEVGRMLAIVEGEKAHWLKEALKHRRPGGRRSDHAEADLERARIADRILVKFAALSTPPVGGGKEASVAQIAAAGPSGGCHE